MSRVADLWERLVQAALRGRRVGGDLYTQPEAGFAANVPSSLGNRDIDDILRAADEIQDDDPNVSRILCEHAYSLAQNLDRNSEGRGVLLFKTGLMSVIKRAKREGGTIDRSQDIARLQEFYKLYREKHNVDKLREEEMKLRESGVFTGNLGELERKTVKRKRVLATLKVLGNVLEQLTKDVSPEEAERLIPAEPQIKVEPSPNFATVSGEESMEVNCYCGRPFVVKTSWTDLNPGRRFKICQNFRESGGCNFFDWIDSPMCDRSKQIIPGLLRRINKAEKELEDRKKQDWWTKFFLVISWLILYCVLMS